MANEKNLRRLTSKEAREIGRKGGIASAKKRQAKKSFREAVKWALEMETTSVVEGELQKISQYERIVMLLLTMINDPNDKRFFQAAQMLIQLDSKGYADQKTLAEIEKIKAETKKISGDKEHQNGMLENLIKGLREDVHTETESPDADVAEGRTEADQPT